MTSIQTARHFFETLYQYSSGLSETSLLEVRPLPHGERKFCSSMTDTEGVLARNLRAKNNVFFGVGLRSILGDGTKKSVSEIPAVWVDVDIKDFGGNRSAAKRAIWDALPSGWSIIVDTGGGYHGYALLKEPAEPEDFDQLERINRGIARRIGGDLASTDTARVLRVPFTSNFKYEPERPVTVVYQSNVTYDLSDLTMFEELGERGEIILPQYNGDGNDLELIGRVMECPFMRHCCNDADHLPEEQWYYWISNLASFRGAPSFIHQHSRPHPKYTPQETNEKILHAIDASPPVSCSKIKGLWDCGQSCGVTSPAGLAWRITSSGQVSSENPFDSLDGKRKKLVEEACPPHGWLHSYLEYAQTLTDAPKIFHLFSALTALSAGVGRKAFCQGFGGERLYSNLWTILLAPSSVARKTTALRIAQRYMEGAGVNVLPQEFSQEQLVSSLAKNSHATFVWSEFGSALSNFNRDYMVGIKDLLADLYDCPPEHTRELRKETFTVTSPYLTILGASNTDWLINKNFRNDLRGGFLARILWVPYTSKDSEMDIPGTRDERREHYLTAQLLEFKELAVVEFGTAKIAEMRKSLREELESISATSEYSTELTATYTRYQGIALKLAMLFDISAGNWGGDISVDSMARSVACIRLLKESIEEILRSIPLNADDELMVEVRKKLLQIHSSGELWIDCRNLARTMHRTMKKLGPMLEEMAILGIVNLDGEGSHRKVQLNIGG